MAARLPYHIHSIGILVVRYASGEILRYWVGGEHEIIVDTMIMKDIDNSVN